jgi:TPP-dependent pyruvate/acetoin dehydrogenase alpha subunit
MTSIDINDKSFQLDLLERMALIRAVEEEIARLYPENQMRCPTHLSIGQETVGAVAGLILSKNDQVVSTHRAHAHYIGKGGNLKSMIAEIHGKITGCSCGKGGSMHLIDRSVGFMGSTAIVGSTIPIGVGIGLTNKLKRNGLISCVFLGDAAVEEGAFHEAANFAVLHELPILFICENNLYSVYSPLHVRQPKNRPIYKLGESYGMHAAYGDGNAPEEVSNIINKAVKRIREGKGPVFLEFSTYRWREHCGPNYDNDLGYRTLDEFKEWRKRDPIKKFTSSLIEKGWLDNKSHKLIDKRIQLQITAAFDFAQNSQFPASEDAYKHVFADNE